MGADFYHKLAIVSSSASLIALLTLTACIPHIYNRAGNEQFEIAARAGRFKVRTLALSNDLKMSTSMFLLWPRTLDVSMPLNDLRKWRYISAVYLLYEPYNISNGFIDKIKGHD